MTELSLEMLSRLALEVRDHPEKLAEVVAGLKNVLPPEWVSSEQFKVRCAQVKDTPQGYREYFWCINGMELPKHAYYGFIIPTYWAHGRLSREELDAFYREPDARYFQYIYDEIKNVKVPKRGIVIFAAREFAKTIAITIGLNSFRVGWGPHKMHFLLQLAQGSAKDNSGKIAEIIQKNPAWKEIFPLVVPDEKAGWGANGYYVKQLNPGGMSDEEWDGKWTKKCATRNAPTILGVGTGSDETIGKHPDGSATSDDVHNFANTSSDRELNMLLGKLNADFTYAPTEEAWNINVGTPWVDNDYPDSLAKSGEFVVVHIPAYLEINPDTLELEMPTHEWFEEGNYVYLWPEKRGPDWVRLKKSTSTPAEFARMVQLNISGSYDRHMKYQTFPAKDIRWQEWFGVVGVDPVATVKAISGREGGVSHFAAAFALKTPYNNVVIADGILKKCDADEAERLLADEFKYHTNLQAASMEIDGGGILFAAMQRRLGLTIHPHSTSEIKKMLGGVVGKIERQYQFLQQLMSHGLVTISDGDTEFLRMARRWADRFPNFDNDSPELDVGDSILLAVFDMPEIWVNLITNIARDEEVVNIWKPKAIKKSIWASGGARV